MWLESRPPLTHPCITAGWQVATGMPGPAHGRGVSQGFSPVQMRIERGQWRPCNSHSTLQLFPLAALPAGLTLAPLVHGTRLHPLHTAASTYRGLAWSDANPWEHGQPLKVMAIKLPLGHCAAEAQKRSTKRRRQMTVWGVLMAASCTRERGCMGMAGSRRGVARM